MVQVSEMVHIQWHMPCLLGHESLPLTLTLALTMILT